MLSNINLINLPAAAEQANNLPVFTKKLLTAFLKRVEEYPNLTHLKAAPDNTYCTNYPLVVDGRYYCNIQLSHVIVKTPQKNKPGQFTYRVISPWAAQKGAKNSMADNLYKIELQGDSVVFSRLTPKKIATRKKFNRHTEVGQNPHEFIVWEKMYGHVRYIDAQNILIPKLPGIGLDKRLSQATSPEEAAEIAVGCATEVKRLNDAGYTHEDIKSDNFLCNGTEVRIIDFDNCEPLENAKGVKQPLYTLEYVAPEIYYQNYKIYKGVHEAIDYDAKQTDVYATGITLLEVFAGCKFIKYLLQTPSLVVTSYYQNNESINPACFDYQSNIGQYLKTFIDEISENHCPALLKTFLRKMVSQNSDGTPNPNDRPSIEEAIAVLKLHQAHVLTPETMDAVKLLYQAHALAPEITDNVVKLMQEGCMAHNNIKTNIVEIAKDKNLTDAIIELQKQGFSNKLGTMSIKQLKTFAKSPSSQSSLIINPTAIILLRRVKMGNYEIGEPYCINGQLNEGEILKLTGSEAQELINACEKARADLIKNIISHCAISVDVCEAYSFVDLKKMSMNSAAQTIAVDAEAQKITAAAAQIKNIFDGALYGNRSGVEQIRDIAAEYDITNLDKAQIVEILERLSVCMQAAVARECNPFNFFCQINPETNEYYHGINDRIESLRASLGITSQSSGEQSLSIVKHGN